MMIIYFTLCETNRHTDGKTTCHVGVQYARIIGPIHNTTSLQLCREGKFRRGLGIYALKRLIVQKMSVVQTFNI